MKTRLFSMPKAAAGILLVALAIAGCSQTNKKTESEAAVQDSVSAAQEQAEANARAEELAKDSIEYTHFTSADLSTFFLHGRVKKMVQTDEHGTKTVYQFNKDGLLVKYEGENDEPAANKIFRTKGRITTLGEQIYAMIMSTDFEYDKDGLCIGHSYYSGHGGTSYTYTSRNQNGWPTYAKLSGAYMHMGVETESTGNVTYKYAATDEFGNWTKRVEAGTMHTYGTSEVYDPDSEEVNEETIDETEKLNGTVVRVITYYTREEVGL